MSIKLIGIDMDGTWLRNDCSISKNTKSAIQEAIDSGYYVVPVTGRSYQNSSMVLKDYRGIRYSLNANGSTLTDTVKNQLIHVEYIPYGLARMIYDMASWYECFIELYEGMDAYIDDRGKRFLEGTNLSSDYVEQLLSTNISKESLDDYMSDPARKISKFHIVCVTQEQRKQLQADIAGLENIYPISVFYLNIEVVHGGWNKACGLQKLAEYLDLQPSEVMAIGDSNNDLEMLKWAGTAVVMGNAEDHVKTLADYVTASNEEDGIVKALKKYL